MPTLHRNNQTYIPSSIRNGVPFSPKWIETLVATCKADDLLNNLMVMEVNIKYLLCVSDGTRLWRGRNEQEAQVFCERWPERKKKKGTTTKDMEIAGTKAMGTFVAWIKEL